MNDDRLDTLMRDVASDVRIALDDAGSPPPFEPSRSNGPTIGVFAAAILIAGGLLFWTSRSEDPQQIDAVQNDAVQNDAAPDEGASDDATPEEPVEDEAVTIADFVTDLEPRTLRPIDRPLPGQSVVDPAFGTTITRVTNAVDGERVVPVQAPAGAWNADETLILLYRSGADTFGHVVHDAETFEQVAVLDIEPNDIEHVFWDPTSADTVWFTASNELRSVSVTTGRVDTVATFEACESVEPAIGSAGPAWDGSLAVVTCLGEDGSRSLLAHRLSEGTTATAPLGEFEQGHAAPSGDAVVVETGTGFTLYSDTLGEPVGTIAWEASSPSLTAGADGTTRIVGSGYEAEGNGAIVTANLDGEIRVVVGPDTGYPAAAPGTRVAATAWSAPGLIVAGSPTPSDGIQLILEGELIVADTRGDEPVVYRLAHTRTSGDGAFSRAFVAISPSGRSVLFSSDWGGGAIDTYVIQLDR